MAAAALAVIVFEYPGFSFHHYFQSPLLRRFLIGLVIGITALYILNSSFGKKSGAHINPAVTLIQYRLGNISAINAIFYAIFQCLGGAAGVYLVYLILPKYMSHPSVNFVVTQPSSAGIIIAFILEFLISFILIAVVLYSNIKKQLNKYTASFVAILLLIFITFESPYTGTSLNPARTFASAIVSGEWNSFWLYCIAPILGMLCGDFFITKVLRLKPPKVTLHND